jgi:hypothetical protein
MGDFELKNNINLDMREQAISNEPEIRKVGCSAYVPPSRSRPLAECWIVLTVIA